MARTLICRLCYRITWQPSRVCLACQRGEKGGA